jgi:hypothetical protein
MVMLVVSLGMVMPGSSGYPSLVTTGGGNRERSFRCGVCDGSSGRVDLEKAVPFDVTMSRGAAVCLKLPWLKIRLNPTGLTPSPT